MLSIEPTRVYPALRPQASRSRLRACRLGRPHEGRASRACSSARWPDPRRRGHRHAPLHGPRAVSQCPGRRPPGRSVPPWAFAGRSLVTTAPAPTTRVLPDADPGKDDAAFAQPDCVVDGDRLGGLNLRAACFCSSEWVGVRNWTLGPTCTFSPRVIIVRRAARCRNSRSSAP
jgi:hypothetical protein